MTIYREDFSEEVDGVDAAGEEDKAEKLLAYPLLQPIETQDQSHIRCRQIEGGGKVGGGQGWLG